MKPEAQRIAIAEACGWVRYDPPALGVTERLLYGNVWYRNAEDKTISTPANRRIVRRDTPEEYDVYGDINYYHATAAQRAEAFLRTLNLWTDDDCRAQESE